MRRLIGSELHKLWRNKAFLVVLCLLLGANVFLLWMDMRPEGNISHAYHTLGNELSALTPNEKSPFIEAELHHAKAFYTIDNILYGEALNGGEINTYAREANANLFDEYYHEYEAAGLPIYTDTLAGDYILLNQINAEMQEVAGYETYLDEILNKAQTLSGVSVFSEGRNNYDQANIAKTAADFADMHGIPIDYYPQRGLMTALGFSLTDIVLIFTLLLVATVLVRGERDNGLLRLIRATANGRLKTANVKLITLALSTLAMVLLLYGFNLVFCEGVYGIGPLSRSIQSVPALMRTTLRLSVGQYLLCFLLTKWLAATIAGLLVMVAMLWAKRLFTGALWALSFLGANLLLRSIIPATSHINILKYANIISMLQTNELIGGYRNLDCFDSPVALVLVESLAATLLAALFSSLFCVVFCNAKLMPAKKMIALKLPAFLAKKKIFTTPMRQESYKLLIMNGVLPILLIFGVMQVYSATTTTSYFAPEEIYYRYYMQRIEGKYTQDSYEWLIQEDKEFEPITLLKSKLDKGEISFETYSMQMSIYESLQKKRDAYLQVIEKVNSLPQNPGAQLVYETGWLSLFDVQGRRDYSDTTAAALICALCFSGLFAMEKQSGVGKLLCATPLGRRYTVWKKLRITLVICAALTLLSVLPQFWVAIRDYGLGAWTAPIYSIPSYAGAPGIPIFGVVAIFLIARFIAFYTMAVIAHALSQRTGKAFVALLCVALLFTLPSILSFSGARWAQWISMYPLFHASALLTSIKGLLINILFMGICGVAIYLCSKYLLGKFGGGERMTANQ